MSQPQLQEDFFRNSQGVDKRVEALERAIGALKPPVVVSIAPGQTGIPNPVPDGFEVYYDPAGTNSGLWHMRYMASLAKWKWLGGGMLRSAPAADASTVGTGASYSGQLTDGLSLCRLIVPFAGDYWVVSRTQGYFPGSGPINLAAGVGRSTATGGTGDGSPQVWNYDGGTSGNGMANFQAEGILTGCSSGQTLIQMYLYSSVVINYVNREFWLRPALVSV